MSRAEAKEILSRSPRVFREALLDWLSCELSDAEVALRLAGDPSDVLRMQGRYQQAWETRKAADKLISKASIPQSITAAADDGVE